MATWKFIFSLTIMAAVSFQDTEAEFRLGSYYSDHMVLQREPSSANVWGYGQAGATVYVSFSNVTYKTVVKGELSIGGEGIWMQTLDPQPAGGPHTLKFTQDSNTIEINDVYFGDVWICSGQSNMEFEMKKVFDAEKELQIAQKYTTLRFLRTPRSYSSSPFEDLNPPPEPWSGPNNDTLAEFSALCWLYGEQLYDTLKVPIGLIETSWGGTRVEAWSSPDALNHCGLTRKDLDLHISDTDSDLLQDDPKNNSSVLWNAMVHPYLKMVLHGAIWYQGEANVADNLQLYNCTFPNLIYDWRIKWHEQSQGHTHLTFPFGFMQLASYDESTSMAWPWLRWHQTADLGFEPNSIMPATFMAVAMDLPDDDSPYGSIHPRDKKTMAVRLGYAGLNIAYQRFYLPFQGPEVKAIVVDTSFAMMLYDRKVKLVGQSGFKYCCRVPSSDCGDDTYTEDWLTPSISQYNSTTMYLKTTCAASNIAYAWVQRPCDYKKCAVYADDEYGLPAAPYKWQVFTEQQKAQRKRN